MCETHPFQSHQLPLRISWADVGSRLFLLHIPLLTYLLLLSHQVVSDSFATPWTLDCPAPLSMGFPRQAYGSGLLFPSPGDLPDPGIESASPALAGRFFTTEPLGSPQKSLTFLIILMRQWIKLLPGCFDFSRLVFRKTAYLLFTDKQYIHNEIF